jgi:hypothetical protein
MFYLESFAGIEILFSGKGKMRAKREFTQSK